MVGSGVNFDIYASTVAAQRSTSNPTHCSIIKGNFSISAVSVSRFTITCLFVSSGASDGVGQGKAKSQ